MERPSWFKFDPTKWLTGRIQRAPAEVQISFIRLCCIYWTNECELKTKRASLEAGKDELQHLLDLEIVLDVDGMLQIKFMDELYAEATEKSRKRKKAADARWNDKPEKEDGAMQVHEELPEIDANAMQVHSNSNANAMQRREEERREEERREEKKTTSSNEVATIFPEHKRFAMLLINDANFRATAAMNQKILPITKVDDYIVSFHEHLAQDGKEHKSFTEFRKHFNSWLRIQTANNIQPAHRYEKQ